MSRQNVELGANALRELPETRRPSGLGVAGWVLDMSGFPGWPDDLEYRGDEDFSRFLSTRLEPYDDWEMTADDLVDVDDQHVVAICRQRGRLKDADSWVELRFGILYTLSSGRIQRVQMFNPAEGALEAAGLGGGLA